MGGPGSGAKPREYPAEIVELVRRLYESGMTIREVQAVIPRGYRAQTVILRHAIPTRTATKRNQLGADNSSWRGSEASYQALHLRVVTARGKPSKCAGCGDTEAGLYEWANLTGRYDDVNDYARMCRKCHRRFDAERRRVTGQPTIPTNLRIAREKR